MTTDYNPHFSFKCRPNMKFEHQDLIDILLTYPQEQITVVGVRNKLSETWEKESYDSASLRRWINNRFISFTQCGWLTRTELSPRKAYYTRTLEFFDAHQKQTPAKNASQKTENIDVFTCLSDELESHKRTIISQMSEIEEYQRLKQLYPSLDPIVTERFKSTVEANYKLLGRMRALETIIAHGREQAV